MVADMRSTCNLQWITLHELLPSAFKHAGTEKTIVSFFLGMVLMSANLWALELWTA